jgi:hypothetical protein
MNVANPGSGLLARKRSLKMVKNRKLAPDGEIPLPRQLRVGGVTRA